MNEPIGKTTSFYELMNNEPGLKIEIPIIQRDYAQGRDSATGLLKNFLKTIKRYLDQKQRLNLDFIYGSIESDKFIPLDGQQRLTTLFLLHWYLAWKSNNIDDAKSYLGNENARFTYETRISSKDFCNQLVSKTIESNDQYKIKDLIMDQSWYYLSWKQDPSIKAMLNTLKSIEDIFDNADLYYGKLISDTQLITFQYIKLNDFGLTDQLYIKMNSRGKPLTEYENLKANVEKIFKKEDVETARWFARNIDTKWTDLLWRFLKDKFNLIDGLAMRFIRASITNIYVANGNYDSDHLKELLDDSKEFNYYLLERTNTSDAGILHDCFKYLDKFANDNGKLNAYLDSDAIINVSSLFESVIGKELTYENRIQFSALCSFLITHDSLSGINEWMRLIRNLSENSRIEESQFANCINTVNKLLPFANDILNHIVNLQPSDFLGFANEQSLEEILKAEVCQDSSWKEKIHAIEDHPYLRGNVGFLLLFAGKFERKKESENLSLTIGNNTDLFDEYVRKIKAVLNEKGINEKGIIEFDKHLFRRALLSKGNYLVFGKGHRENYSFLINTGRDVSWKRYFKSEHVNILKMLLDDINPTTIIKDLENLVDRFDDKGDWRYYFIKLPELIGKTGPHRLIRFIKTENANEVREIYLLEKTQMNGRHREYYSYALCIELRRLEFTVEYTSDSRREGSKYISTINNNPVQISYWPYDPDDQDCNPDDQDWKPVFHIEHDKIKLRIETMDEVIDWVKAKFSN